MRFSTSIAFTLSALLVGCANGALIRRVTVSPGGTISSPTVGTTIASGETFSVNYGVTDICHAGYSPISFYLLTSAPTDSDVTPTGTFADPLFHFGDFLVPNFGLPPMTNPPPPPSTFTMPDLDIGDSEVYFAVIETFNDCPPDGHTQYGLSANAIEFDA